MRSVTGSQKLCKTPTREVRHGWKFPKIENSLCRAISLQQVQFNSIDSKRWRRGNANFHLSLRQLASKCMQRGRWNSFRVCTTLLALWIHESSMAPTVSAIPPSYTHFHLVPVSTCSKCSKRLRLNSFHICIAFPAGQIHENSMAPTLSAILPSYTHFHLFPMSTHL